MYLELFTVQFCLLKLSKEPPLFALDRLGFKSGACLQGRVSSAIMQSRYRMSKNSSGFNPTRHTRKYTHRPSPCSLCFPALSKQPTCREERPGCATCHSKRTRTNLPMLHRKKVTSSQEEKSGSSNSCQLSCISQVIAQTMN